MKTKSSKKAHRAPTITELVARRNAVVREKIAIAEHDGALRRKHKLGPQPRGIWTWPAAVVETFPSGFPLYKPGRKVSGASINSDALREIEKAKACHSSAQHIEMLRTVCCARTEWTEKKYHEQSEAYDKAELAVGIVRDDKRDERLHSTRSDYDDAIIRTPARTPGELLAKARCVAYWLLWEEVRVLDDGDEKVGDLLQASKRRLAEIDFRSEAFILLYRGMVQELGKLKGPKLEMVTDD